MSLPVLNCQLTREVDRRAVEEYGMHSLVLMENAGRGCTDRLCERGVKGPVVICAGGGNNGGDGLVVARHLDIRGYQAKVLLFAEPDSLRGDAAANYEILQRSGATIVVFGKSCDRERLERELEGADWIVDALLGTGAKGDPRPPLDEVIEILNSQSARRLAVDTPSGLDCDTGEPASVTFRADVTCTFVAAKPGFLEESARPYVGEIVVQDIGAPRKLIEEMFARQ